MLNSVRANTRHIFNAWSHSNGYIADVDKAIAVMQSGGYNFDSKTPDEQGYTDIGWYALVAAGESNTDNSGAVIIPVKMMATMPVCVIYCFKHGEISDITDNKDTRLSLKALWYQGLFTKVFHSVK
jgi:hypothetical protein